MIAKIRQKPWLLVIAGIVFFTGLTLAFVVIAICNAPATIR